MATTKPDQDVLDILGIENWDQLSDDDKQTVSGIATLLDSLSSENRATYLEQLRNNVDPGGTRANRGKAQAALQGGSPISGDDLKKLYGSLSDALGTTAPTVQAQTTPSDDPNAASNSIIGVTKLSSVSQAQKDAYEKLTGQNFDTAYQSFAQNYTIAVRRKNQQTGRFQGDEQLWTSGNFQAPENGWQISGVAPRQAGQEQISEAQFFGMQATTVLSYAKAVEDQLRADWTTSGYGPLPADLLSKIYENLRSLPPEDLALAGSGQQGAQTLLASGGQLDSVIQAYKAEHNIMGVSAQAAESTKLASMESLNAPSKEYPWLTVGAVNTTMQNTEQLWLDNFGKAPSGPDITRFAGWSKQEIADWVDQQKSPQDPNVTIGERRAYQGFADKVSNDLWGTGADDRTLKLLGDTLSQVPKG